MEQREDKFCCKQTAMNVQNITLETNSELSLPDYLGEISRLLRVWPRVLPPRRFISGGTAEFTGRICYDVLYAGDNGRLHHVDMEDTYSFSLPCQGEGASPVAFLLPDVVVGRVVAPRRLSVRCRMHAQACTYLQREIGLALPPEERECACLLGETIESGRYFTGIGDAVELQESFELPGQAPRVILSRGEVFLPEVTAARGVVRCRGEVVVTLLCCEGGEGGEAAEAPLPFAVSRSLPFTAEVPLEGVSAEDTARAVGVVESLREAVEGNRASLSVGVLLQVEAAGHETTCYVRDLFLPHKKTECVTAPHKSFVPTLCKNQNYSLSATPTLAEAGLPSGATVIDACADAEITEKSFKEGQMTVRGDVHCQLLYCTLGEWGVRELKIPFSIPLGGAVESALLLPSVPICRVQQEATGLRVAAELVLAALGGSEVSFLPVLEVHTSPLAREAASDLEFYYPAKDETLWEIARRFALPPEEIAAANGFDAVLDTAPDISAETGYLMLPLP